MKYKIELLRQLTQKAAVFVAPSDRRRHETRRLRKKQPSGKFYMTTRQIYRDLSFLFRDEHAKSQIKKITEKKNTSVSRVLLSFIEFSGYGWILSFSDRCRTNRIERNTGNVLVKSVEFIFRVRCCSSWEWISILDAFRAVSLQTCFILCIYKTLIKEKNNDHICNDIFRTFSRSDLILADLDSVGHFTLETLNHRRIAPKNWQIMT
ncbi:hypothetical protein TcasGA2_TC006087 [Tribolium castaneum]|uniref:Uncharacterized protein n=1 Tax=Tribolium castaneum TaxID=7070 RepID=D6WYP2_TRICA|nr:hypothetical protein TcasGA2_TC006087 [Tribolium castaneum]